MMLLRHIVSRHGRIMLSMNSNEYIDRLYAEAESLLDVATMTAGEGSAAGFRLACENYAKIISVDPAHTVALENWGYALTCMARDEVSGQAEILYNEAVQKFQRAVALAPSHRAYHLWGDVLVRQGCVLYSGEQARERFIDACGKFATARELKPDSFISTRAWADALTCLAEEALESGRDGASAAFYRASSEKYAEAAEIAERLGHADHAALMQYRYAEAVLMSALDDTGADAVERIADACGIFKAWGRLNPDDAHALCLWGTALGLLADWNESSAAIKLYRTACDKFETAMQLDPDQFWVLQNWARALMAYALLGPKRSHQKFMVKCQDLLEQVEAQQQDNAIYLRACYGAISGDYVACRRYLEIARDTGRLPEKGRLQRDRLLTGVQATKWFGELISAN